MIDLQIMTFRLNGIRTPWWLSGGVSVLAFHLNKDTLVARWGSVCLSFPSVQGYSGGSVREYQSEPSICIRTLLRLSGGLSALAFHLYTDTLVVCIGHFEG